MRVGPYELLIELGRGGMGVVYLAQLAGVGGFRRLVALKRCYAALQQREELVARFLNEARLAAYIHHANVVSVHQLGMDADGPYLVTEYVEGASLMELSERTSAPLPPAVVLRVAVDALAGLQAIHNAVDLDGQPLGILHRDVSPENLLIGRDGVTRVTDFGIAKSMLSEANIHTQTGQVPGKLLYLSPERMRGEVPTPADDIYALGVSLWIALTSIQPFGVEGESEAEFLERLLHGSVPALAEVGVAVSAGLEALLARACARSAAERFATAQQMAAALTELIQQGEPLAAPAEVSACMSACMIDVWGQRNAQLRRAVHGAKRGAVEARAAVAAMDSAEGGGASVQARALNSMQALPASATDRVRARPLWSVGAPRLWGVAAALVVVALGLHLLTRTAARRSDESGSVERAAAPVMVDTVSDDDAPTTAQPHAAAAPAREAAAAAAARQATAPEAPAGAGLGQRQAGLRRSPAVDAGLRALGAGRAPRLERPPGPGAHPTPATAGQAQGDAAEPQGRPTREPTAEPGAGPDRSAARSATGPRSAAVHAPAAGRGADAGGAGRAREASGPARLELTKDNPYVAP